MKGSKHLIDSYLLRYGKQNTRCQVLHTLKKIGQAEIIKEAIEYMDEIGLPEDYWSSQQREKLNKGEMKNEK